jgi:hypothetical protein
MRAGVAALVCAVGLLVGAATGEVRASLVGKVPEAADLAPAPVVLVSGRVQPIGRPAPATVENIDPQRRAADRKLAGMIVGLYLHELGHAMISELGLPAVGPEEDVADEFASIVYMTNYQLDPDSMKDVVLGSAEIWRLYEQHRERKGWEVTPWFDEHAADMVRFGKILCLLYGADPETFAPEMDAAGIPEDRRRMCILDFQRKWTAWEKLLRPHRRAIDPRLPGDQPADAPGGRIVITHGKVYSKFGKAMAPIIQSSRIFEGVSEAIEKYYVLPRDLHVNLYDCEDENGWYSETSHAITLCYGLFALMAELTLGGLPEALAGQGLLNTQSIASIPVIAGGSQPTLPSQSADSLQRTLLGTWQSQTTVDGLEVSVRTEFSSDGTFTQLTKQEDGFAVTIYGGWSVQAMSANKGRVASFPTSWSPAEYCRRENECQTLRFTPESNIFTVIDRDTLEVEGQRMTRVK